MRRRRRGEEANLQPRVPVKKGFEFFKIIQSAIIRNQQLGLPKKFVRKFGNYLADVVVLRVPNDKTWHVELRKAGGEAWLGGKSWEEFVEYHSICVGHFLVFRYDGSSQFYVLIFDMSGTEIHYQCNSYFNLEEPSDSEDLHVVSENRIDESDEDESVEVLGVSPPNDLCSKQDKSVGVPISRRHATRLSASKDLEFLSHKKDTAIESAKAFKSKYPFYVLVLHPSYVNKGFSRIPSEFVKRHMPMKSVSVKLEVKNGRTWPVVYTFRQRFCLCRLDKGWNPFVRDNNLKKGDVCVFELINKVDIVLKVSIFRVAEILHPCNSEINLEKPSDSSGIHALSKTQMDLSDEDESVEVLGVSPSHNVHLTQDSSVGVPITRRHSTRLSPRKDLELLAQNKNTAIESTKAFKSKHPFYVLVLHPSYVDKGFSGIPSEFVKKHMPKKSVSVKLEIKHGRTWLVDYIFRQRTCHSSLAKGWKTFLRDNNLKKGDVCVFELINKVDIVLKVSIFRDTEILNPCRINREEPSDSGRPHMVPKTKMDVFDKDESVEILGVSPPNEHDLYSKRDKSVGVPTNNGRVSTRLSLRKDPSILTSKPDRAIESAKAFKSKHPFCVLVLHSSYVTHGYSRIPSKFVTRHMPKKSVSIKLEVKNGRTWPVDYIFRLRSCQSCLTKGWKTFVRDNNLKKGDVCVFELINKVDIVLKVSIFRDTEKLNPCRINREEPSDSGRPQMVPRTKMDVSDEESLDVFPPNKSVGVPINVGRLSTRLLLWKDPSVLTSKTDRAIESAKAFKSKHPFYVLVLRQSYVTGGYSLIPSEFIKRYMPKNKATVKLKVSNGRTWTVDYQFRRQSGHTKLSKGWTTFAKENKLKKGDVCVFELINKVDIVLKVSIFRVTDEM